MSFRRRADWVLRAALGLCTCLAVSFSPISVHAGDYRVRSWGVDEGLPQSSVTDIAQTPDGYLWIGTLLAGVSRFDGVHFVNFSGSGTNGLAHPGVRRLLVDPTGTLWVNDYGNNLYQWQPQGFEAVGLHDVLLGSLIARETNRVVFGTLAGELVEGRQDAEGGWHWERHKPPRGTGDPHYVADALGVIWYQAPGARLGRYAQGQFEILTNPPGLEPVRVQTLARDEAGCLWLGTSRGLARWTGAGFTNANPPYTEAPFSAKTIIPVGPESFWVEGNGKLRLLAHGHWAAQAAGWDSTQSPWSRVRSWRSDNRGGLWLSLQEEGLAHVSADGTLSHITGADGLPSQLVQAFYPDRDGTLWTGYHRGGLVQVRRRLFHPVARAEGLLDTVVTSVSEDAQGRIWIGTAGGTVACWNQEVCLNLTLPLHGRFCQDVVLRGGPDGRVWIGTGGNGLLVWEQGTFRHVVEPADLARGVRLLLVTRDNQVWFANLSGVYKLEGNKPVAVLEAHSYTEFPTALVEGPRGEIWLGTCDGRLLRFQNGTWTTFTPEDGFPASRFWALLPEADGTVWVGTMDQGLLRFRAGKFARLTTRDGLPDNEVCRILADAGDGLWLGSRAGIARVGRQELEARAEGRGPALACRVFGRGAGLLTGALTLEFQPGAVSGRDGRLWFGTANGVAWVQPAELGPPQPAPRVVIESVAVNGKPLPPVAASRKSAATFSFRDMAALLRDAATSGAPSLVLGPGVRGLDLHFVAPDFTAPEQMRYKYRLEGLDPDWTEAGNQTAIHYSRLPPGEFTFRVTAMNSDGIWDETGAALRLEIRPYLWERSGFTPAVVGLGLGSVSLGVVLGMRRRLNRKLERLARQRELERERARIAQDLHDDLGAGLTEISLTTDLAQSPELPVEESRQYVREIGTRARELVQSMDEIVWAVNPRNDSVSSLAAYICQYAQRVLKAADIRCRLDVQADLPAVAFNAEQRYQLFLAFKEAVSNVARHSKATELQLCIQTAGETLRIALLDNGCGFDPSHSAAEADGLHNMRERLRRLGGQCVIESQAAGGSKVQFVLPLCAPAGAP